MKYVVFSMIIFVVIALIWALYIKHADEVSYVSALRGISIPMLFACIFLASLSNMLITDNCLKTQCVDKLVSSEEIIASNLDTSIEGEFFLGCGSIKNEPYYFFYTQDKNDNIKLNKIHCDEVILKYCTQKEMPKVEKYTEINQNILTSKPSLWNNTLMEYFSLKKYDVGDVVNDNSKPFLFETTPTKTIIYIPEGSIQNNFDVSLE